LATGAFAHGDGNFTHIETGSTREYKRFGGIHVLNRIVGSEHREHVSIE